MQSRKPEKTKSRKKIILKEDLRHFLIPTDRITMQKKASVSCISSAFLLHFFLASFLPAFLLCIGIVFFCLPDRNQARFCGVQVNRETGAGQAGLSISFPNC